jgi:hypothetical protein
MDKTNTPMKRAIFDRKAMLSLIKCCSFFVLLFLSASASAQTKGKVVVVRPALFDTLLAKRASLNRNGGSVNAGGAYTSNYGYRLQVYSGTSRNAAYAAQAKFNSEYPEIRSYMTYHEPYFKVKVGDFRTRLEAEKMKAALQSVFQAMFIVSEKIIPPKTVTTND